VESFAEQDRRGLYRASCPKNGANPGLTWTDSDGPKSLPKPSPRLRPQQGERLVHFVVPAVHWWTLG
jgi:hypothetical protein